LEFCTFGNYSTQKKVKRQKEKGKKFNKTAVIRVSGYQEVDIRKSGYQALTWLSHKLTIFSTFTP